MWCHLLIAPMWLGFHYKDYYRRHMNIWLIFQQNFKEAYSKQMLCYVQILARTASKTN